MTLTRDTIVVDVLPRISRLDFINELRNSPAHDDAGESYDALVKRRVDPLFCLALFWVESQYGNHKDSIEKEYTTRNPGMRRSTRNGMGQLIDTRRGVFCQYPTWVDGFDDIAAALVDENFVYIQQKRNTVSTIINLWAPAWDNNDPDTHVRIALLIMNRLWKEEVVQVADLTTRILEAVKKQGVETHDIRSRLPTNGSYQWVGEGWPHKAVHYTAVWRERNTLEAEIASWRGHASYHVNYHGWPGIAYAIGISASGRVFGLRDAERMGYHAFNANAISIGISTDITQGQKPTPQMTKSLNVVLRAVDELLPNSKPANTFGHNELKWYDSRNAGTTCPGDFLLPMIATYRSGKDFSTDMAKPVLEEKVMQPDKAQVQVPGIGTFWIIGNIFKAWTNVAGNVQVFGLPLTGMFGEGTDKVQYFERAVLREKQKGYWPDNFDVDFEAVGRLVYKDKYGDSHAPGKNIPYFKDTAETRVWIPDTQHSLSLGFLSYWRNYGGLKLFGWPISEPFQENGRTVQYFERARFEHHPGVDVRRFDVLLGRVGAEALEIRNRK